LNLQLKIRYLPHLTLRLRRRLLQLVMHPLL
jgi:hypothetical protein